LAFGDCGGGDVVGRLRAGAVCAAEVASSESRSRPRGIGLSSCSLRCGVRAVFRNESGGINISLAGRDPDFRAYLWRRRSFRSNQHENGCRRGSRRCAKAAPPLMP
jgi:hypothetical protein